MKKPVHLLSIIIGATVLIVGLIVLYVLNRPLPVSLDDPKTQPIKDALVKSHKIETLLHCDPESDISLLDEVYKDTADYKQIRDHRVIITRYLGEKAVHGAGYLTFMRAYYIWDRSGDPYPSESPDTNPTVEHLYTLAPVLKPVRRCPDPLLELELQYRSIAIREVKAIAVYSYGPYLLEVVLRKFDDQWFIVSLRALSISP